MSHHLETLSSARPLEPLTPVPDTDISAFLKNERHNAIISAIEDAKRQVDSARFLFLSRLTLVFPYSADFRHCVSSHHKWAQWTGTKPNQTTNKKPEDDLKIANQCIRDFWKENLLKNGWSSKYNLIDIHVCVFIHTYMYRLPQWRGIDAHAYVCMHSYIRVRITHSE